MPKKKKKRKKRTGVIITLIRTTIDIEYGGGADWKETARRRLKEAGTADPDALVDSIRLIDSSDIEPPAKPTRFRPHRFVVRSLNVIPKTPAAEKTMPRGWRKPEDK